MDGVWPLHLLAGEVYDVSLGVESDSTIEYWFQLKRNAFLFRDSLLANHAVTVAIASTGHHWLGKATARSVAALGPGFSRGVGFLA